MINFQKYLSDLNEGKILLKRKYTENHPEKTVRQGAKIRNSIIEALNKIFSEPIKTFTPSALDVLSTKSKKFFLLSIFSNKNFILSRSPFIMSLFNKDD